MGVDGNRRMRVSSQGKNLLIRIREEDESQFTREESLDPMEVAACKDKSMVPEKQWQDVDTRAMSHIDWGDA